MLKIRSYLAAFLFIFSPLALAAAPQISISWSPSTIYVGQTSTLAWNVTGANSCVDQNGSSVGMTMNWTSSPRTVVGTQTKTLTCTGPGGTTTKGASLTVKALPPKPSISISWSPSTVYVGQTSTLSWSVSGADSCVDQSGASAGFSMNWTSSPRTSAGTQTKSLTCTNIAGSTSKGATLTVLALPNPPSVSTSFNKSSMYVGDSVTFSWSSSGASSCSLDGGSVSTSGNRTYTPGSAGTFSKSVSCSNIGGSRSASASTSVVNYPTPTVSASFGSATLALGESTLLSWSSTYADYCTIDSQNYSTSGSINYSPGSTGTYSKTVTCSGRGGSKSAQVSLSVIALPIVDVSWSKNPVWVGEIPTLNWSISNATACYNVNSAGDETVIETTSGSWPSTPAEEVPPRTINTFKKIRCENQFPVYSSEDEELLIVNPLPQPTGFSATRLSDTSIQLNWNEFLQDNHNNRKELGYYLTTISDGNTVSDIYLGEGDLSSFVDNSASTSSHEYQLMLCLTDILGGVKQPKTLCTSPVIVTVDAVTPPQPSGLITVGYSEGHGYIEPFERVILNWETSNANNCYLTIDNGTPESITSSGSKLLPLYMPARNGKEFDASITCGDPGTPLVTKNVKIGTETSKYIDVSDSNWESELTTVSSTKNIILYGSGTLTQDLTISRSMDGRRASVNVQNYTLKISGLQGGVVYVPELLNQIKTDTAALEVTNVSNSTIYTRHIKHSETLNGISMLISSADGSVNNNLFYLGKHFFFQKNMILDATSCSDGTTLTISGNRFFGGQLARGVDAKTDWASDSAHLVMNTNNSACISENTWFGTSMEGTRQTTEARAHIHGDSNNFINVRWEGVNIDVAQCSESFPCKAQVTLSGSNNTILSGYDHGSFIDARKNDETSSYKQNICTKNIATSSNNAVRGWLSKSVGNVWIWEDNTQEIECQY
ncbi:hypothetical protein KIH87_19065 [Paraneptunicella aestuarii]|uniref:hypothetical protein n=1 Tax=Paraneptunicella aestuarii TaxID=2831148 RepID=UPI001E45C9FA|nr:hypothetical protein [Paraneptunicella aestuarii]UAA38733.1 hypothetical protein KIH87_19065 [Paraneptunicella aestuarii]